MAQEGKISAVFLVKNGTVRSTRNFANANIEATAKQKTNFITSYKDLLETGAMAVKANFTQFETTEIDLESS